MLAFRVVRSQELSSPPKHKTPGLDTGALLRGLAGNDAAGFVLSDLAIEALEVGEARGGNHHFLNPEGASVTQDATGEFGLRAIAGEAVFRLDWPGQLVNAQYAPEFQ